MFFAHLQKGQCIWRDRRQQHKHRAGHIPTFAFEFLLWEDAVQWHELAGADLWLLPPSLCHLLLAYSRKQINITDSICKANNFSQGLGSCAILTGSRYLPVCASTTAHGVHAGSGRHQKGRDLALHDDRNSEQRSLWWHWDQTWSDVLYWEWDDVVDTFACSQQAGVTAVLGCGISTQETWAAPL